MIELIVDPGVREGNPPGETLSLSGLIWYNWKLH